MRVVLDDTGAPVLDQARCLPGRGAWVHLDPGCLDLAERRKAFQRALRVSGPLDHSALRAQMLFDQAGPTTGPALEHDQDPTIGSG